MGILRGSLSHSPELICLGASTGGPLALSEIFYGLNKPIGIPVLIVQHMPAIFTAKMAQLLNAQTEYLDIREAVNRDSLLPGKCYVAPGGYHMRITEELKISLSQNLEGFSVHPSVDVLFHSIAESFPGRVWAFVLTGMGTDGSSGAIALKKRGDQVFVQDRQSSAVWGMPEAVLRCDQSIRKVSLSEIIRLMDSVG